MYISQGLVEQHIHGAFGIDFMNCGEEEIIYAARKLFQCGITAFFPTVMTENIDKIKNRISVIKKAMTVKDDKSAQIAGIHLEGPFINCEKAGIHPKEFIKPLNIDIFKQIEDEAVKIITLAPELDKTGNFIPYLKSKNIKISAGHCVAADLSQVNQVTHLFNAMDGFNHRNYSTPVNALNNNEIFIEIIADSKHVNDDVLKITFKQKPIEKILLISDALAPAHSNKKEHIFAGQTIYNKNGNLVNKDGTIAGSSFLLCDIVKNIADKHLLTIENALKAASLNQLNYHKLKSNITVYWNETNEIEKIIKI